MLRLLSSTRHCTRVITLLAASITIPGLAGSAQAAAEDPATDRSEYQRKLVECKSQMTTQHPEMDSKARRKACKAQVGPEPQGVVAAKAAAPVR